MEQVKQQVNELREERESLRNAQPNKSKSDLGGRFMESIIQTNLLVQSLGKLLNLEQLKLIYDEQLSTIRAYSISLLETIYVSERPVAPKTAVSKQSSLTVLARTISVVFWLIDTR